MMDASRSLSSGARSRDPLARNNIRVRTRVPATQTAPELIDQTRAFSKSEGAGNAGRSDSARSLVCEIKKHTSVVTTVTPESPGIPRAMVLTAYIALSPGTGLSCPRHRRDAKHRRQLDASVGASGPHGFAVRRKRRSSRNIAASTASRPALMTLRNAPLSGRDGVRHTPDLHFGKTEI